MQQHDVQTALRLSHELVARLDELAQELGGPRVSAGRAAAMRHCLLIGLPIAEALAAQRSPDCAAAAVRLQASTAKEVHAAVQDTADLLQPPRSTSTAAPMTKPAKTNAPTRTVASKKRQSA